VSNKSLIKNIDPKGDLLREKREFTRGGEVYPFCGIYDLK
jgi:hypothetical protein